MSVLVRLSRGNYHRPQSALHSRREKQRTREDSVVLCVGICSASDNPPHGGGGVPSMAQRQHRALRGWPSGWETACSRTWTAARWRPYWKRVLPGVCRLLPVPSPAPAGLPRPPRAHRLPAPHPAGGVSRNGRIGGEADGAATGLMVVKLLRGSRADEATFLVAGQPEKASVVRQARSTCGGPAEGFLPPAARRR